MPRLRFVVPLAVFAAVAAGCGSGVPDPTTTTSPAAATTSTTVVIPHKPLNQLVGAAIDALRDAKSVQVTSSSPLAGTGTYTIFSDGSGTADTTVQLASGTVHTQVIAVGSDEYVRAPAAFWESLNKGFTSDQLADLASHWVLFTASARSGLIATMRSTVEQFLDLLAIDLGLKLVRPQTVLGTRATGLRGSIGGLELWLAAIGTPYPIELSGTSPRTLFTFTNWNVGAPPAAPAGSIGLPTT